MYLSVSVTRFKKCIFILCVQSVICILLYFRRQEIISMNLFYRFFIASGIPTQEQDIMLVKGCIMSPKWLEDRF
jgi:hypothetical protein